MSPNIHHSIHPCVCCKNNSAREIADYYVSVFPDAMITIENHYKVIVTVGGQWIMLQNVAAEINPNPSISLIYLTTSEEEVVELYTKLEVEGNIFMPLNSYPFSPKYAWVEDRYGVSWQLIAAEARIISQIVVPAMLFVRANNGKATEAMNFYTALFPRSEIRELVRYTGMEGETVKNIQYAKFILNDYLLMCTDSSYPYTFNFNEGVSLVVECNTQGEIDRYWNGLTADGGKEMMCGRLTDKYGVNWQITTREIEELIGKSPKVLEVMSTMKKPDIRRLHQVAALVD